MALLESISSKYQIPYMTTMKKFRLNLRFLAAYPNILFIIFLYILYRSLAAIVHFFLR
jgi:hypothetical protein